MLSFLSHFCNRTRLQKISDINIFDICEYNISAMKWNVKKKTVFFLENYIIILNRSCFFLNIGIYYMYINVADKKYWINHEKKRKNSSYGV
jgi:hypothetical protein